MILRIECKIQTISNLYAQLITAINLKLIIMGLRFFTILREYTKIIKNSVYHLLKINTSHIAIL